MHMIGTKSKKDKTARRIYDDQRRFNKSGLGLISDKLGDFPPNRNMWGKGIVCSSQVFCLLFT